ncbi:MAG: helix-turn-helix domain-containing protein, partial [Clostridiales bacterium]|nr:helix-turn-helix domain-containing protein [Clostridiales bacterium]
MQFNEKLKELRTKKGVSQSELADGIYVSRSAVAKWENGLGLPSNESLRLLAEYFEVNVDELCADGNTEKVIVNKNQIIS